jgi:hypothetical protein
MSHKANLYIGKAGQLHVMSEFLMRGWNVATPEVDTGDDIFVVEYDNDTFNRIQVKTAQAIERKNGYSFQANVPLYQLQEYDTAVYFIFAVRRHANWADILVISQGHLLDFFKDQNVGSVVGNSLMLYFSVQGKVVTCSSKDFSVYLNNFTDFPIVKH